MPELVSLREHEEFGRDELGLGERDWKSLEAFTRRNQQDKRGD